MFIAKKYNLWLMLFWFTLVAPAQSSGYYSDPIMNQNDWCVLWFRCEDKLELFHVNTRAVVAMKNPKTGNLYFSQGTDDGGVIGYAAISKKDKEVLLKRIGRYKGYRLLFNLGFNRPARSIGIDMPNYYGSGALTNDINIASKLHSGGRLTMYALPAFGGALADWNRHPTATVGLMQLSHFSRLFDGTSNAYRVPSNAAAAAATANLGHHHSDQPLPAITGVAAAGVAAAGVAAAVAGGSLSDMIGDMSFTGLGSMGAISDFGGSDIVSAALGVASVASAVYNMLSAPAPAPADPIIGMELVVPSSFSQVGLRTDDDSEMDPNFHLEFGEPYWEQQAIYESTMMFGDQKPAARR